MLAQLIGLGVAQAQDDVSAGDGPSIGFLFDRFKLTLEDGYRTEAAGPFYYSEKTAEGENIWAIPPFYSHGENLQIDREQKEFLYPLMSTVRYGDERRWQFFQVINTSYSDEPGTKSASQFTIFPIYFQQRSADTNLNYTAVIPFYGRIENRLFRDEIYFVMMPFYVQTRKKDVVIDNYCFPFVDVRHGDGMKGWQVWPFAGHSHKVVTTQTNNFGDVSIVGGYDHLFYLWPFYFSQDNGIGTDNPSKLRATLPFYAYERSPLRDSTTIFWPFFTTIDERGRKYHEWQMPWPFIIFTRGEGKHTSRVWPVFSQSSNATRQNDSYLWPVVMYTRTHSPPLDRRRFRILLWLYSRIAEKNTATGKEKVRLDMMPFFTWQKDFNGNTRLQVIVPIEPAIPDSPGVDRNWSPLWSIWRGEHNPNTGASSQSFLWNLYRRDAAPEFKKVSCLFGLYQYRADKGQKSLRLFYIPVMSSKQSTKH